jgi:hypothetical protein
MFDQKKVADRLISTNKTLYGVSLVAGLPFPVEFLEDVRTFQRHVNSKLGDYVQWLGLKNLHVTILRSKSTTTPWDCIPDFPSSFNEFMNDLPVFKITFSNPLIGDDGVIRLPVSVFDPDSITRIEDKTVEELSKAYRYFIRKQHSYWVTLANISNHLCLSRLYDSLSKINELIRMFIFRSVKIEKLRLAYFDDISFSHVKILHEFTLKG